MSNLSALTNPRNFSSALEKRTAAREALNNAVGADKIAVIALHPEFVQSELINGTRYLSLVDLIEVLTDSDRPRKYWNDRKRALLLKDPELSESIGQLKLPASDGKKYKTDVAPLWSCLLIASFLQTPASIALMKAIFKGIDSAVERSVAEVKYRAQNIANGYEWAADQIHETVKRLDAPDRSTDRWWEK